MPASLASKALSRSARVQPTGPALPRLAQNEERECAGCEARRGGGLGGASPEKIKHFSDINPARGKACASLSGKTKPAPHRCLMCPPPRKGTLRLTQRYPALVRREG